MKKRIIALIIVIITMLVILLSYLSLVDLSKAETETIQKENTKEEYIYKEDLLELGYTVDEIKTIESKISNNNVKTYLMNKKYNNLVDFVYSPYFKTENIDRYQNYYENNNYSSDEVVLYVEIGLDKTFYTEINEITDYENVLTLVNKYNKLPSVEFNDLTILEKPYSDNGKRKIRQVAYDALKNMIDNAKTDNIKLFVVSGFRTNKDQTNLFNNSKKKNGLDHALVYSAKPGHSEHELGLAVDLNSVYESFSKTKEYEWLKLNAYKYGFIERYQKGKEFITGFNYEPWHYRYVGEEVATKIFKENITFEEYLIKYKDASY